MAMNILIKVISKIAEYTVQPVGRELGYLCFLDDNFQELQSQVEKLKNTRGTVQGMVFIARRNAEDIKPVVEQWLSKVDNIVGKLEAILANESGHGGLCSTNPVQRYKLSRQAREMADEALEMKNEGDKFDTVSFRGSVSLVHQSSPPDFHNFESRKSTMEKIMNALFDDNVHRIGVYGMGGVGKTTLVNEILRKIVESKSFDEVVTSTISRTPDLKIIQGQLADKLGLKFEQETIEGRALMLRKRLKMEKSILIMLDDVWEYIDLERIGIPSFEHHAGCKILFTSRDKHLISNEICVEKIFEIKVLRKDESWNLLKKMADETVEARDLQPIATQIVSKCAGLPIAITTVAKALKGKPSPIWNDALDQLKKDDVVVNIRGMNKEVYSLLKLSYDFLECEEVKLLFLLCSMFPEDFDIDVEELQLYAISMGFLHGVDTMAQGRRRITKLVDDLISSSLLLQSGYEYNYVKMHDLVRDVAILIASKNDHIRTLSYVKRSNEELEEEKLSGNHTAVSLIIQGLYNYDLQKLMLPKVQLFMLIGPGRLVYSRYYASTFLEEMKELKGLVLEEVRISLSPSSLYSFANIRLLCLRWCKLVGSIDMIGELKKLEILDFSGSNIAEIPTTISQLTQLKVLNLSNCYNLFVIPPNILSKLTKLEELSLETFDRWEGEEWYERRENASLSELRYLPHLYTLNLTIQDEEIMPKHLFSGELNFEKFNITIGCSRAGRYYRGKNLKLFRKLYLKMESGSCLDDWIKTLLKRSEELGLEGSICSKVLHPELLDANEFLDLKQFHISGDLELQNFIHEKNEPLRKYLSKLEYLHLEKLQNLESIIHGYGGGSPFNKLRNVRVEKCNKLETLFFNCNFDDVLNLEMIDIAYCKKIEVMITVMENEEATDHIEFTHLKSLFLYYLPQLQKFCSKIETLGQLSRVNLENPETSTDNNEIGGSFFSEEVSLPSLDNLRIYGADNLKMIWSNVLILNSFSKLKLVVIDSCNNLQRVVFPPNMISILTCLNILSIKNCKLLEGIFEAQEPISVTNASPIVLQNLTRLELYNLPNLEYVWSKNPCELLSFVNMETFSINKCSRLKREYSVKILKQLETLRIDMRQLMEVVGKEKSADHNMLESKQLETSKVEVIQLRDGSELFPKLTSLKLYGFVNYSSTHLPMEIVQILYQLRVLELEGAFIEEIFPMDILIPMKKQYARSMILRNLVLSKLPKLRHLLSECTQKNTSVFQELFDLRISECGALSSLVSSSVSFTNLHRLEVDKCDRLTHLLNPLVARTLVQLEYLRLEGCKRMSTVIEGGAEEGNDEIVFNDLKDLTISSCSKLTSFYCGRCIIKFPRLRYVAINNCPEMKVFSLGIVNAPHLKPKDVRLNDTRYLPKDLKEMMVEDMNVIVREYWEDNIDTSIPYFLFAEENLEGNQSEEVNSSDVEE